MAVVVTGVVTRAARTKWALADTNGTSHKKMSFFRIGEGGWEDVGGVKEPRTPDDTLTNIDVIENPGRYPAECDYYFQKSFGVGDVVYEADRKSVSLCVLDFTEGNDDGHGNNPEFWEVGVFDEDGTMIVYGTFPKETKTPDKELEREIRIYR